MACDPRRRRPADHRRVVDPSGIALAAIQELNRRLEQKTAELQAVTTRVAELTAMVELLLGATTAR